MVRNRLSGPEDIDLPPQKKAFKKLRFFGPWVMHKYALCLFTSGGALFNQANLRCIAHAGYFDKLQDNKHLREKTTVLREKTTAFSLK